MKGHSLEVQNHCSLKSYTVEMKKILVLTNSAKISKLIIQFYNEKIKFEHLKYANNFFTNLINFPSLIVVTMKKNKNLN